MSVQVKGSGTIGGLDEGLVVSGIVTSSTQVNVGSNIKLGSAGVVTATSFVGSGANLTSLPAANLTGTLPAISGANLTSLPSQVTIANNADNRVITGGSGTNLNGESTFTHDPSACDTSIIHNSNNPADLIVQNNSTGTGANARLTLQSGSNSNAGAMLGMITGSHAWYLQTPKNAGNLEFQKGGLKFRMDNSGDFLINDGNLVIGTSGHGIDFSATPNGYSGTLQETLDDYEEGYWTPTVGGWSASGTGVYGDQKGRYTKIGNTVTVFFHIYWTALNNASGVFAIESLPFPHASNQYYFSTAVQMRYVDYSGDTVFAIGGHDYSSSLLFYAQNDNGNHNYVPIDSNGGRVEGCVTYLTDS